MPLTSITTHDNTTKGRYNIWMFSFSLPLSYEPTDGNSGHISQGLFMAATWENYPFPGKWPAYRYNWCWTSCLFFSFGMESKQWDLQRNNSIFFIRQYLNMLYELLCSCKPIVNKIDWYFGLLPYFSVNSLVLRWRSYWLLLALSHSVWASKRFYIHYL